MRQRWTPSMFAAAMLAASLLATPAIARADALMLAMVHDQASSLSPDLQALVYRPWMGGAPHGSVNRALAYQPHRPPTFTSYSSGTHVSGSTDLYGGFYEVQKNARGALNLGLRAGVNPDPHLRVGMAVEWTYKSENLTQVLNTTPGPGGVTITSAVNLSSASVNLLPVLGFLEITPFPRLPIAPYGGLGGGYEWLHLTASDATNPTTFVGDYGGWGWEAWAGAALKMGHALKLFGEAYHNAAVVGRDALDVPSGQVVRESVTVDGSGIRGGLAFNF